MATPSASIPDSDGDEKPYVCSQCGETFRRQSQLSVHQLTHKLTEHSSKNKPYTCSYCQKKYSTRSCLEKHELAHTSEEVFNCRTCNKVFQSFSSMRSHETGAHMRPRSVGYQPVIHSCEFCDKTFRKRYDLQKHTTRVHTGRDYQKKHKPDEECPICQRKFRPEYMQKHIKSHQKKPHICSICHQGYINPFRLKQHFRIHDDEARARTELKCATCGKIFSRLSHLRVHEATHAADLKKHLCSFCNESFDVLQDLERHEFEHSRQVIHVCGECGKQSNDFRERKKHEHYHFKRNRQCLVCSYKYENADERLSHMKLVHGMFLEEPGKFASRPRTLTDLLTYRSDLIGLNIEEQAQMVRAQKPSLKSLQTIMHLQSTPPGYHPCHRCSEVFINHSALHEHTLLHFKPAVLGTISAVPSVITIKSKSHPDGPSDGILSAVHTSFTPNFRIFQDNAKNGSQSLANPSNVIVAHSCIHCGEEFPNAAGVIQHAVIHTGRDYSSCPVCVRGYLCTDNLEDHLASHLIVPSMVFRH